MFYNVIRSSNENLTELETQLKDHDPRSFLRPRMTVFRRVKDKRRPQPFLVQMYPGYAFVRPEAGPFLHQLSVRWSYHYLRSPTTGIPMEVPAHQLDYACNLEFRSMIPSEPYIRGTRVHVKGLGSGTVQESIGYYALVWIDESPFPVRALLCDTEPLPATPGGRLITNVISSGG